MQEIFKKPRGTQDIFFPKSMFFKEIRRIIENVLEKNNCRPIIFPSFESLKLFTASLDSTTDIINKEMFVFKDKKGRELALRPEGTVSVARLICENKLLDRNFPLKIYYWANMFRYERPQKGRYREFWQLGLEMINCSGIIYDIQIIQIIKEIFESLKIDDLSISINYLGNSLTQSNYKQLLKNFIEKKKVFLCENCQRKYQTNLLRILDCFECNKNSFPSYEEAWSEEDRNYVKEFNNLLNKLNVRYEYDYKLVRGLDYYTGLIFEIRDKDNISLAGGGRYDNLYKKMFGYDYSSIGFAFGVERLINYLVNKSEGEPNLFFKDELRLDVFFSFSSSNQFVDFLEWKKCLDNYNLKIDYNMISDGISNDVIHKLIKRYSPKLLVLINQKNEISINDCLVGEKKIVLKELVIKFIKKKLNLEP